MSVAAVFLLLSITASVVYSATDEHITCAIFKGNHTFPVTMQDENGKKCRGVVLVSVCGGLCHSSEKGSVVFPNKEAEHTACAPIDSVLKKVALTDCDEGALEEARSIEYHETSECGCKDLQTVHPE